MRSYKTGTMRLKTSVSAKRAVSYCSAKCQLAGSPCRGARNKGDASRIPLPLTSPPNINFPTLAVVAQVTTQSFLTTGNFKTRGEIHR